VRAAASFPIIDVVSTVPALIAKLAGAGTSDNLLILIGYFGLLAGLV
jgi:hypothetical protein